MHSPEDPQPLFSFVWSLRHQVYQLRRFIPFLRRRHRLESMVGPLGCWDDLRRFQFEFLRSRGLQPHHSLLDIGCGPLQGGLEFIRYLEPGKYAGIDIRTEPLAAAYIRVAKSGLTAKNPRLAVSSSFGREELGDLAFDYIWASQVLYHLDAAALHTCFSSIAARMKSDSKFYGNVIPDPKLHPVWGQWEGFPFHPHPLDFIRETGDQYGLKINVIGTMRDFGYPVAGDLHLFSMLEIRKRKTSPAFLLSADNPMHGMLHYTRTCAQCIYYSRRINSEPLPCHPEPVLASVSQK
ncbi:MAG: class I SAM-dependent methyltransferase [Candidatus Latescibacterota bacterium]